MDIEKAKEISSSSNWADIVTELDLWIKSEETKLRYCTPDGLGKIQATINLLETVKRLPQIVIEREE